MGELWTGSPPNEWGHIIFILHGRDQDCGFRGLAVRPLTDLSRRMTYRHQTSRKNKGKKKPLC